MLNKKRAIIDDDASVSYSITETKKRQTPDAKCSQTPCSTCFQLTLNEIERFDSLKDYLLQNAHFAYAIAAKELAPSTGHEHVHVYVQFGRSVRLSFAKLQGAHVEKCCGTAEQNVAYVTKDGDIIWEEGTMRTKKKKTIAAVQEMSAEERRQLPVQYYNIVQKIAAKESAHISVDDWHKEIKCYYIWGESGIGKSCKAKDMVKEAGYTEFDLVKFDGTFWHGVTEDCPVAIYDDWRDSHMKPYELINFLDYNVHPMNVKGGTIKNRYKLVIITTIQDPAEIYGRITEEQRLQWERRMVVLHLQAVKGVTNKNN